MNDGFAFLTALTTHMSLRNAPIWPNDKLTDEEERDDGVRSQPTA
jgi:hypothetical protein